ncbi:MAG: hypothetical protein IMY76_02130 [Chloroflexi bacterium]|nr:hypothetical protein [Chloroflexota bacterium]
MDYNSKNTPKITMRKVNSIIFLSNRRDNHTITENLEITVDLIEQPFDLTLSKLVL